MHLLEKLSACAVIERRFLDASYYLRALGAHFARSGGDKDGNTDGDSAGAGAEDRRLPDRDAAEAQRRDARCARHLRDAALYAAFDKLQDSNGKPFTSLLPEVLFHAARFVLNTLGKGQAPYGVSRVLTLFTLAKQGKGLGAYKLARYAYDRLQRLKVPTSWMNQVDLDVMTLNAKPYSDREELLPVCFCCSTTNPLLNNNFSSNTGDDGDDGDSASGDCCVACGHPFVRSSTSFDHLPLVQFVPADGISDAEAIKLIMKESDSESGTRSCSISRSTFVALAPRTRARLAPHASA